MIRRLIILLLIVGLFGDTNNLYNDSPSTTNTWHFIMPEFQYELNLLLEYNLDIDDSSNYIEVDLGRTKKLIWDKPLQIYLQILERNLLTKLSEFLNTENMLINYSYNPYYNLKEYYPKSYPQQNISNKDSIKAIINKIFTTTHSTKNKHEIVVGFKDRDDNYNRLRKVVSFHDTTGTVIHAVYDYNKNELNELKKLYTEYNKINKGSDPSFENFINQYNIIDLQKQLVDGVTIQYARSHFDILIDSKKLETEKDLIKLLIKNIHPFVSDCNNCISFKSVDIDSLKNLEEIKNGVTTLFKDVVYDKSYAIIIGIDNYENISNLDYAVNDAVAVKEMLINQFNYEKENIKLLINEDANKENIEQSLENVSDQAGQNDRIIVFFAGHGETMSLPDGGEMGYLLPVDGKQENLYSSAIPMNDLKDLSHMSKAKHMLFLIDACYGGLAAVGTRGLEPAKTPNYLEKITNIKARQIITAGGSDEKVIEKPEWGHSAYTMNLLRALKDGLADTNGDGYITAGELGLYLNEKVTIDSENQQTPQSRRLTSHEGEFIFFNNP